MWSQVGFRKHHYEQSWWRYGIPVGLFQILKRWCCESVVLNMPANLENSAAVTGLESSVSIPIPKKGNANECSNQCTIALISHTRKAMLKVLQARFQQYVNRELPDVQAGFRKVRGARDQIANIIWIIGKVKEFQKKYLLLFYWLCQSLWLCTSHKNVENSSRNGNTRPPDLPLEESIYRSGSNS